MKKYLAVLLVGCCLLMAATAGHIQWTQIVSTDRHGTDSKGQSSDGTGTSGNLAKYDSGGGLTDAGFPATVPVHPIGANFDGGGAPLTTGTTVYYTYVGPACTIQTWNMTVAPSGTATGDIWKVAGSGGAIPTVTNSITASAPPSISSGTALTAQTGMTGWTKTVAQYDVFAFTLTAVSSATAASLVLQCQ